MIVWDVEYRFPKHETDLAVAATWEKSRRWYSFALAVIVEAIITDVLLMTSRARSNQYGRSFTEAFIRPGLETP